LSLAGRKIAIILHGPPCTVKTTLFECLARRFPGAVSYISLDDGWVEQNSYRLAAEGRYADLATDSHQILVVEVGCGEPIDLSFPGATRNATEWVDVLRRAGREIFPFLLTADWDDVVDRLDTRYAGDRNKLFLVWQLLGLYALYEHRHPMTTFPLMPDFIERPIRTSGRTEDDVVDEILSVVGIR
jgi:hypothetical protein